MLSRLTVGMVMLATVFWPLDVAAQRRRGPGGGGVAIARPIIVRPGIGRVGFAAPWYPFGFYGPAWSGFYGWGWGGPFSPGWGGFYGPYWGAAFAGPSYGSVRLQVEPRHAEVFVDGYFAGHVDDFDGAFQRLDLPPGEHEIQVYLDGYRTSRERVYVVPGRTSRLRSTLERQPDGLPAEARPEPAPSTQGSGTPPTAGAPSALQPPADPGGRSRRLNPRAFGRLVIRVQPADAQVLVDGEGWQTSSGQDRLVVNVPPGAHRLEIQKDGYLPYSALVDVEPGGTATVNVSLTTEGGSPGR